ncbi:hypothetical protein BGZ57DRAFT_625964 [Hyaloscypha finlandica]|nr:hypothetical protein BGZ57DRAFT_625964 [Hyaloscypha finlandica]
MYCRRFKYLFLKVYFSCPPQCLPLTQPRVLWGKKANAASKKSVPDRRDASNNKEPQDRGCRFWLVFAALLITGVLRCRSNHHLHRPTSHCPQPQHRKQLRLDCKLLLLYFHGRPVSLWKACHHLGRRWLMIGTVVVLTIGSSVAGWTSGAGMLIAGRSL